MNPTRALFIAHWKFPGKENHCSLKMFLALVGGFNIVNIFSTTNSSILKSNFIVKQICSFN